jgi:hypothetical protein
MTWNAVPDPFAPGLADTGRRQEIELVGVHLRMTGNISVGAFNRLSDLVNHGSGYVKIEDAVLLRRNGEPTSLTLPELMVDQDEISFIAQRTAVDLGSTGDASQRPSLDRRPRRFVIFTPGHTISGLVHVFGETTLAGFVEATHPRFVPVTEVTTRSLADRRIISHYAFMLVNRTQMIAVSDPGRLEEAIAEAAEDGLVSSPAGGPAPTLGGR